MNHLPTSPEPAASPPARSRRALLRLLLGPAVLAAAMFGGGFITLPRTFDIELRLANSAQVRSIELRWFDGEQLLKTSRYHFDDPSGREPISSKLFVEPGRYRLTIAVDRPDGRHYEDRIIALSDPTHPVVIPLP